MVDLRLFSQLLSPAYTNWFVFWGSFAQSKIVHSKLLSMLIVNRPTNRYTVCIPNLTNISPISLSCSVLTDLCFVKNLCPLKMCNTLWHLCQCASISENILSAVFSSFCSSTTKQTSTSLSFSVSIDLSIFRNVWVLGLPHLFVFAVRSIDPKFLRFVKRNYL